MEETLLTVVTLVYNHEKYIEKTIESIVSQQTNFKFQFYISDDCSTDKSREIIDKYYKKYPDIIKPIYSEKNKGSMKNFMETLNMVNTKYLAICDGDDYWTDNDKLQKQVDFLENNKEYNICFHKTNMFFENKKNKKEILPKEDIDTLVLEDVLRKNVIPANSVVYRWKYREKDSFKKVFPINMVPGDHYVHLLHLKDGKAKCLNEVMSKYRRHENGMWWLTTDPEKQLLFHLKNGELFLNFYKNIIKEFNLDKKYFFDEMRYIVTKTTESYIKNNEFEKLVNFHKENKELVELCTKELTFNKDFTTFQRRLYLFLFENKIFRQKLKRKLFKNKEKDK